MRHLEQSELEAGLEHIRNAPVDAGRLDLIVCRPGTNERRMLEQGVLDAVHGLLGDNWRSRGHGRTKEGLGHPDMQLALMDAPHCLLKPVSTSCVSNCFAFAILDMSC